MAAPEQQNMSKYLKEVESKVELDIEPTEWKAGLFGCLQNPVRCCIGFWFPCILGAEMITRGAPFKLLGGCIFERHHMVPWVAFSFLCSLAQSATSAACQKQKVADPKGGGATTMCTVAYVFDGLGLMCWLASIILFLAFMSKFRIKESGGSKVLRACCCGWCLNCQVLNHLDKYEEEVSSKPASYGAV
eukprot:TRINITY_DN57094_c0_g1_i1.p1 TRINITY_DN57094_c0_g1~~TRINITY_DN57094_c0_g1_i1.p1  ORF type:complete len:213 (+),score=31.29 TRINITY_DN57094_c0_g1_i1:75-641(+)